MGKSYFSLEVNKSNKLTRIFQIFFGIICAIVAIAWLVLNFNSITTNLVLLITIVFLLGFAYYQVNSGLGRGEKFIEIGESSIKLKRNSILPSQELKASDIEKIEAFPLKMVFFRRSGKIVLLRFGTTFIDTIDPVKKEIESFCRLNKISYLIIKEEI